MPDTEIPETVEICPKDTRLARWLYPSPVPMPLIPGAGKYQVIALTASLAHFTSEPTPPRLNHPDGTTQAVVGLIFACY
jgi:hypothetical protein